MKSVCLFFILFIFLAACDNDSEDISPIDLLSEKEHIGDISSNDNSLIISVFADDALTVGYNRLYVRTTDLNGNTIDQAPNTLMPHMYMPSMEHAAPMESLGASSLGEGIYEYAMVFTMPSEGEMMRWEIWLDVEGQELKMPITVAPSSKKRMFSFVSETSGKKLFIALVDPQEPKVGINDFELAIFEKKSMMEWPPVDYCTISFEPEMPSMGHGSPNNEYPVSIGNGHYKGKVNFTMDGLWQLNLIINENNIEEGSGYFEIEF